MERLILSKWTVAELDRILQHSFTIRDTGERIDSLSRQFLGIAYKESTLIGGINTPEVFVINLEEVDCFTFIEYIESMRLSGCFPEFKENLKRVRYRQGKVTFKTRKHFFTDWREYNQETIEDVTAMIGGAKTARVKKRLNLKSDGAYIIPGISPEEREINYIPVDVVDDLILNRLKTGDYAGIYSDETLMSRSFTKGHENPPPLSIQMTGEGKGEGDQKGFSGEDGLDVSHVGIIIKSKNAIYLRHASSLKENRKVIDADLRGYLTKKPGLVILRPKVM